MYEVEKDDDYDVGKDEFWNDDVASGSKAVLFIRLRILLLPNNCRVPYSVQNWLIFVSPILSPIFSQSLARSNYLR